MEMSITAKEANQYSQECKNFITTLDERQREEELAKSLISAIIEKQIKRWVCLGSNSCIVDLKLDNNSDTYKVVSIVRNILESNGYKTEDVYHSQKWYKLAVYW